MASTLYRICFGMALMMLTIQLSESAIDDILIEPDLHEDFLVGKNFEDMYEVKMGERTYTRVELDILIEEERMAEIYQRDDFRSRGRRSAIRDERYRWTNNRIPYKIDDSFSAEEKLTIMSGMEHWMLGTCLLFVPASDQEYSYIKFIESDRCYSLVGMNQDEQVVSLSKACANQRSIVIHEIGHVIGLFHEQSRYDRDDYIDVIEENIRNETGEEIFNFDKISWKYSSNFSTPYDYTSIMHYGKSLFSKDKAAGLVTLIPKDVSYLDIIGEATKISAWDAKMVNEMYKCSADCKEKQCPDGGFLGRRCECLCPGTDLEPLVRCDIPPECPGLPADTKKYSLFTRQEELVDGSRDYFPDGTELLIAHNDRGCDRLDMDWIFTCRNGKWDGELPPCILVGCPINETWYLDYNISVTDDQYLNESFVKFGEMIELECLNRTHIKSFLRCDFKFWIGNITMCPSETCELFKLDHANFQYILAEGDADGVTDMMTDEENEETVLLENAEVYPDTIITARCKYDMTETNMTCDVNGWDIEPPSCTERRECPQIENATVRGSYFAGYTVHCIEGYQMTDAFSNYFECTWDGNWSPDRPKCVPQNCELLDDYTSSILYNSMGVSLSRRSIVQHGETVTVKCTGSFMSPYSSITCKFGKWSTKDGLLPTCKEVTCGPPPFDNVRYLPVRDRYMYGSFIFARGCHNEADEFVGDRNISCGTDGKWSGSAKCIPYCPNSHKSPFKLKKDKIIAAKESKIIPSVTAKQCKRLCRSEKSFPCKAVVWGPSNDPTNAACKLHTQSLQGNQNAYMKRPVKHFHLYIRQC